MAGKLGKKAPYFIIAFTLLMCAVLWVPGLSLRISLAIVCALPILGFSLYLIRTHVSAPQFETPESKPVSVQSSPGEVEDRHAGSAASSREPSEAEPAEALETDTTMGTSDLHEEAHTHISEALLGMGKVIPILTHQLKAVIDYTEDSAMQLSQSFISINRKAKNQVQDVQKIFGSISEGESQNETEGVLIDIRDNLNSLTEGLDTLLKQIHKNSESINKIFRQTQSIEEIVATTNDITENSRVLSINATIEAARAGEQGKGFAVVAGEFKKMTEKSEEASKEIEETVQITSELIASVQKEIEESKEISRRLGEQTKNQGRESVDKIDTVMEQAKNDLDKLSRQAEAFAKDINNIIVSIQFQDITRQRIEHVIEPLDEFSADLEKIADYIKHIEQAETIQQLSNFDSAVDRLKQKYTMEAEKELIDKSTMNKEAAQEEGK